MQVIKRLLILPHRFLLLGQWRKLLLLLALRLRLLCNILGLMLIGGSLLILLWVVRCPWISYHLHLLGMHAILKLHILRYNLCLLLSTTASPKNTFTILIEFGSFHVFRLSLYCLHLLRSHFYTDTLIIDFIFLHGRVWTLDQLQSFAPFNYFSRCSRHRLFTVEKP
jgi:hypothetical protein